MSISFFQIDAVVYFAYTFHQSVTFQRSIKSFSFVEKIKCALQSLHDNADKWWIIQKKSLTILLKWFMYG